MINISKVRLFFFFFLQESAGKFNLEKGDVRINTRRGGKLLPRRVPTLQGERWRRSKTSLPNESVFLAQH